MTLEELSLWQKQEYTAMRPGLEHVKRFLSAIGDPQRSFKCVHISGTNGKGSTAKMIADILSASGYRTGLYISPHLVDITERIQLDSKPIARKELDALSRKYIGRARKYRLTFFEFITALCFIYFSRRKVEIAVIETGLGGRFDATNVVDQPLVSIITDIDFDHKAILGNTLRKIAFEKAGIVKMDRPVISGAAKPEAAREIRKIAGVSNSALFEYGRDFSCSQASIEWMKGRQAVKYSGIMCSFNTTLSLLGAHQLRNCGLALAAAELLNGMGFNIQVSSVRKALNSLYWPGRFELIRTGKGRGSRFILLDGAHNPGAARNFTVTWRKSPFAAMKPSLIFGMLKDKAVNETVRELPKDFQNIVATNADSPRAESAAALAKIWKRRVPAKRVNTAVSLSNALAMTSRDRLTVVTGSLYLVGETLKILKHQTYAKG